jgi:apolipoprotein N-acyltransferase
MTLNKLKAPLGCLFAGMLYALGFPSILSNPLLTSPILGFAIYFHLLQKTNSLNKILLKIIFFSLGFNLLGFYWIPHTLTEFGAIPSGASHLLWGIFSLIILPQHWVGAIIFFWIRKKLNPKLLSFSILIAFIYTLLENVIPQQFPAHIGHSWLILKKNLVLAPFFGAAIYSFISYLLAMEISHFRAARPKRIAVILSIIGIIHVAFPKLEIKPEENLNIRIIQANISNAMKIAAESDSLENSRSVLHMYRELSLAPHQLTNLDLIIWPETAYPFAFSVADLNQRPEFTPQIFKEIYQQTQAEILIGGYDRKQGAAFDDYFETEWNSAILFSAAKPLQVYHKHMLIPFGETLPFGPFNRWLSQHLQNVSFFARGQEFNPITLKNGMQIITPICYEILSPQLIRTFLNSSTQSISAIINLTNDSWYGDTVEPAQHLFLAHWRALEFQIPIIRSTNTGISSVLYADGEESLRLNLFERKKLDLKIAVTKQTNATFFQRWGLWGTYLLMFFFLVASFIYERKENLRA